MGFFVVEYTSNLMEKSLGLQRVTYLDTIYLHHTYPKIYPENVICFQRLVKVQWLSGRVLDSRPKGRGFEPHRRHCVVSLSKNINPSLVLVQPRKTSPFITERLLMGCKESNLTKILVAIFCDLNFIQMYFRLLLIMKANTMSREQSDLGLYCL